MTFPTIVSRTTHLSLREVIERLVDNDEVEGVVLLGSMATGLMSAHSDLDILVVLSRSSDPLTSPFEVVFTSIEGRPADVIVTTFDDVSTSLEHPQPVSHERESLLRWISEGTVAFDRTGRVNDFIRRITGATPRPWTERERRTLWWRANFAAVKARRYLAAGDPAYADSVIWILSQGLHAALVGYFAARHLPWRGEKDAMVYWTHNDEGFRRAVAEIFTLDSSAAVGRYLEVVEAALGPVGGRWQEGSGPLSEVWESLIVETAR